MKMIVPSGLTSEVVVETLQLAASRLAPLFAFGYYDKEDIKQEAFILGMECLPRFDPHRNLYNFVYTHMRNRLGTLKRDKYCRINASGDPTPSSVAKRNLINTIDILAVDDVTESTMRYRFDFEEDYDINEANKLLSRHLSGQVRQDWLRIKHGTVLPRHRRDKLYDRVKEIFEEHGYSENW